VVISLHEHTMVMPEDLDQVFNYIRDNHIHTGYAGLAVSGLDAVVENFLDGIASITSRHGWKWDDIIYDIGMRLCDLAHQDFVILATRVDDILRAHREGKVAMIAGLEAATMIENELDRLDILYGFGVRMMGITYSEGNPLGAWRREPRYGGQNVVSRQAVERMIKLRNAIYVYNYGNRPALATS